MLEEDEQTRFSSASEEEGSGSKRDPRERSEQSSIERSLRAGARARSRLRFLRSSEQTLSASSRGARKRSRERCARRASGGVLPLRATTTGGSKHAMREQLQKGGLAWVYVRAADHRHGN